MPEVQPGCNLANQDSQDVRIWEDPRPWYVEILGRRGTTKMESLQVS